MSAFISAAISLLLFMSYNKNSLTNTTQYIMYERCDENVEWRISSVRKWWEWSETLGSSKDWFAWISRSVHSSRDRKKIIFAIPKDDLNLFRARAIRKYKCYRSADSVRQKRSKENRGLKSCIELRETRIRKIKENGRYKWKRKRERKNIQTREKNMLCTV